MRVERHTGPRNELRHLFEEVEDAPEQLAAYMDEGMVLIARDDGGRIVAQTKDHSVVQKMVDAGYLAQAAIRQSLQRSKLFAALGHNEDFVATVEQTPFAIRPGDVFLLCTDGFWEYVDESTMQETLARETTPAEWLRDMVDDVVKRGGREQDNFSALAIFCSEAAPPVAK